MLLRLVLPMLTLLLLWMLMSVQILIPIRLLILLLLSVLNYVIDVLAIKDADTIVLFAVFAEANIVAVADAVADAENVCRYWSQFHFYFLCFC